MTSGDYGSPCNNTPYTATHQTVWSSIRVLRPQDGTVTIEADGDWTSGPGVGSGSFRTVGTYKLLADRVQVVRYREK